MWLLNGDADLGAGYWGVGELDLEGVVAWGELPARGVGVVDDFVGFAVDVPDDLGAGWGDGRVERDR